MMTTYAMYAMQFLQIDMIGDAKTGQLVVDVPGYAGDFFRVKVDTSGVCPKSTHCRCSKFAHKGHCQHTEIVDCFYAKLYKSNIVKASEKALEEAMDASDELEAVYEEVAFLEQIATTIGSDTLIVKNAPKIATSPKLAPKVAKKGNKLVPVLNGQAQSNQIPAWLAILPSRQNPAA